MKKTISLLLVEDSDEDATWIRLALRKATSATFNIDHAEWLATAITAIGAKSYDVVLLDLTLPDSHGIDTLVTFMEAAPHIPTIVLTGYDDMDTAMKCMKYGAQDYQLKEDVKPAPLERSIIYAIERRRRDLVGKRLLRASISQFTEADEDQPATLVMLKEHVRELPRAIEEVVGYVRKNAPQCQDDIEAIFDAHNVATAVREMREILHATEPPPSIPPPPHGAEALAQRTMKDLKFSTPSESPADVSSAQEALADIIEDLNTPLKGGAEGA